MEELKNNAGGYIYSESENKIAEPVDLITLPSDIVGTNCANCKFIQDKEEALRGKGYCIHPKILLPVTARMCCALWDNTHAIRSWKHEDIIHVEKKRESVFEFLTKKVPFKSLIGEYKPK